MARKALRTGCANQRAPVVVVIYKIFHGQPAGRDCGKKSFGLLSLFSKSDP